MRIDLETNDHLLLPLSCKGVFSPEECQELIDLPCQNQQLGEILDPNNTQQTQQDLAARRVISRSVDASIPQNKWIFERLQTLIQDVNQQFFKQRIHAFDAMQILEYPINGFYEWHMDLGQGIYSTRKLSVIVFLSPSQAYEGGQLLMGSKSQVTHNDQGSVLVFPSFHVHKVTPVTAGKRYTMVTWVHGPFYQ